MDDKEVFENVTVIGGQQGVIVRRALLFARTVRHLRTRQIIAQISRRLTPQRAYGRAPALSGFNGITTLRPFLVPRRAANSSGKVQFLNQQRAISPETPDWLASDMSKLWRYNLHYFDYLKTQVLSPADKARLIDDWIACMAPGKGDAWEPYPLSLRVVNWLKFVAERPASATSRLWLESLILQLASLRAGIEHHLLANHVLKNLKALLFGGIAFSGPTADDWLQFGLQRLRAETAEQVLRDGGHFERSPMYHCIVLEDYLDLVNLLLANPMRVPAGDMEPIIVAARRATEFLRIIVGGDDMFPLFNDAAFGIAAPPSELLDYADSVLTLVKDVNEQYEPLKAASEPIRVLLPDSGFFGYRQGGDSLILDCGHIGPDYQPGHAHCDTLSFELCVGGHRIIVDSGVYDYELGAMRDYVRSTRAHNTVMVDGVEQSEIWGVFRVARRAHPLCAELSEWREGQLRFRGSHDGYHRIRGRLGHEREFLMHQTGRWEIRDLLTGHGHHKIQSFVHFHPDCTVEALARDQWRIALAGGPLLRFSAYGGAVRLTDGWYCPEFGKRIRNAVLVIEWQGRVPMECGYVLERLSEGTA